MLGSGFLGFVSATLALCSLGDALALGPLKARQGCTNTATTRSCWSAGYDINSDPDTTYPPNGQIRSVYTAWVSTCAAPRLTRFAVCFQCSEGYSQHCWSEPKHVDGKRCANPLPNLCNQQTAVSNLKMY